MTFIVKVESEAKDIVLRSIYDELKGSLGQFSKKRPGLIACCIEGIYPEQWGELRSNSGLAAMSTRLLNKKTATHIHTLTYSSNLGDTTTSGNITVHKNRTLFFRNENCKFFNDQNIFD